MRAAAAGLALLALAAPAGAAAVLFEGAGLASVAYWNGFETVACTAPLAVSFADNGTAFVLAQVLGAGTGLSASGCAAQPPLFSNAFSNRAPTVGTLLKPDAIQRDGGTYTVTNSYPRAGGAILLQTSVLEVLSPTSARYAHEQAFLGAQPHIKIEATLAGAAP